MSIADQIIAEAQRQRVDPNLALEVAMHESSLNQDAMGSHGEIGVFQLMPETAAALGVDPTDLAQNIQGGVRLLGQLISQFGDPAKALAAYNCGAGCVTAALAYGASWFAHIPSSTRAYVSAILADLQTQYTAAPAAVVPSATGSVLNIPPAVILPAASGSIWGTLALGAAIILGLGFVLSET